MALGQFYAISADMRKPYYVCGGLQDNGSWCGPSATRIGQRHPELRLVSASAAATASTPQNDPTDWATVYSESQDGEHEPARSADRHVDVDPAARAGGPRRRRAAGARRRATPAILAQFGFGSGGGQTATSCRAPPPGTNYPLLLEHAVHPVAAQPAHDLSRRAIGCSGRTDRGDTWMASPDLTQQHRPQRSADHGRRRHRADGVEARRRRVVQQHRHDQRIAASCPASLWVGTNDGNVQVSRDGGATWKNVVGNVHGRAEGNARVARRGVALRRRHRVRDVRRAPHRRSQAVRLRDDGLRRDVDVDLGEPARGQRQRDHAKIRRTGTCSIVGTEYGFYVSLNGGQRLEAVHERAADGAGRRRDRASARQRSDSRHARPQHLDHGRHHGAAAAHRRRR